jgi:sensor domain CHASE-containing protein
VTDSDAASREVLVQTIRHLLQALEVEGEYWTTEQDITFSAWIDEAKALIAAKDQTA